MASIHHHFLLPILLFSSSFVIGESSLFMEYIGAQFKNVKFSDVPINSGVNFNFILSFAIDYTTSSPAFSTNGNFNEFWDTGNLSPSDVATIKSMHPNVKVSVSIGGDSVGNKLAYFKPTSVDSWVTNAVSSLTNIMKRYNLDGIDIDYEHFSATPDVFAECIGQLITKLKENGVISFASIAPFDNDDVHRFYQALWSKYNQVIDYVNFQFYAYDKSTTVAQFLDYYNTQTTNYDNGKVLVSFNSDGSRGLMPENGFFDACRRLKLEGKLHGIFIWCADDSKAEGFKYEIQSQQVLTS